MRALKKCRYIQLYLESASFFYPIVCMVTLTLTRPEYTKSVLAVSSLVVFLRAYVQSAHYCEKYVIDPQARI